MTDLNLNIDKFTNLNFRALFQNSNRIYYAEHNQRIEKNLDGSLHIKDVTQDDNAKYVCRAENGYGNFVTGSLLLRVRRKSRIVTKPQHALYKVRNTWSKCRNERSDV